MYYITVYKGTEEKKMETVEAKRFPRLRFWLTVAGAFIFSAIAATCGESLFTMDYTFENVLLYIGMSSAVIAAAGFAWLAVEAYRELEKPIKADPIAFGLIAALWSYSLSELCMDAFIIKTFPLYNLLGYSFYAVAFLLGAVIFRHPKVWYCVWEVLFAIYSVAQYYLTKFRGAPVKFTDFQNLRSAMEVKSEYKLTMSCIIGAALLQIAAMMFITIKTELVSKTARPRLITLGAVALTAVSFALVSRWSYDYGVNNRYIRLNFSGDEDSWTSRNVGSMLMFYYDGVYNHVIEPEGYSDEKAREILAKYSQSELTEKKTPVIIGILNESFADYSHIAPLSLSKDYMPVVHSLKGNSITGFVTVSPYGGYSCNSEYEFLTGNSMHFLPLGSAVYTNYLKSRQDSIVTALNAMNFDTISFTPCGEKLWDIGKAYEYMGFKYKYFYRDLDLDGAERMNSQITDSALFKKLCEYVDARDKSKGAFYWVTTMQNHAPYSEDIPGGVELEGNDNVSVTRYLNTVYQSDKAVGELIDHFKDYDEEVIIVMFGDHYPHIAGFADELYDSSVAMLGVEDYSLLHQTPFFIWSNRGLEAKELDSISLNYLGNETFKVAGLPLTPVQQELEHIREKLPIVSGFGCMTDSGKWYKTGEDIGELSPLMNEYNTVQYYRMFSGEK